jgi:valyl-tRNA synthetase
MSATCTCMAKVFIPLINREIPVILDEYVTMDFGTGCLKVTPAHDLNDYALGQKHNLPIIDILNDDGTLNEKAQILVGEDRFAARKKIAVLLEEAGALAKTEDYTSQIGFQRAYQRRYRTKTKHAVVLQNAGDGQTGAGVRTEW